MKRYIKLLTPKLEPEKQELFKKHIEGATKFLLPKLSDLQLYVYCLIFFLSFLTSIESKLLISDLTLLKYYDAAALWEKACMMMAVLSLHTTKKVPLIQPSSTLRMG